MILRDGTIFLQGADAGRAAVVPEAVVGGTGRYAGVSGTATTDFTGTVNKITLRLRR